MSKAESHPEGIFCGLVLWNNFDGVQPRSRVALVNMLLPISSSFPPFHIGSLSSSLDVSSLFLCVDILGSSFRHNFPCATHITRIVPAR